MAPNWSAFPLTSPSDLHTDRLPSHHFAHHMGATFATTRRELVSRNWVISGSAEKAEHSLCPAAVVYWLFSLGLWRYFLSLGHRCCAPCCGPTCGLWDWLLWYGCDGRRGADRHVYFTVVGTTLPHNGTGTTAMGGTAPMQWRVRLGHATMCFHTVAPHAPRARRGWHVLCCFVVVAPAYFFDYKL